MLTIVDVHKSYRDHSVLRGVNLSVSRGEILGLIGSNGAGKTTLISIASGLRTCQGGQVLIGEGDEGIDVVAAPKRAAGLIGLAPQDLGLYPMLTTEENLVVFGELAGLSPKDARRRARQVAEDLGIDECLAITASALSGGQARRLHTGMALMHRPPVLFLDEPTVGADVSARRAILSAVRALAGEGTAIVYTTHYLTELVDLGVEVAILDGGTIVLRDTVKGVLARHAHPTVAIVTIGAPAQLDGWTADEQGARPTTTRWCPDPESLAQGNPTELVAQALERLPQGTRLIDIEIAPPTLESAFLEVTGQAISFDDDTTIEDDSTTEAERADVHVA